MARGDEITTKFKVDISDLKKGISEANQEIKLANAQFKAATAGMDNWSKSADGIKAKLAQLDSILKQQKDKLSNYNQQLERQQKAYQENGQRADQLRAKLLELANNGVSKTSDEYKKYENALAACEKEQDSNKKSIDDLKITILNQQAALNKTEADIRKYSSSLDKLETEQRAAAEAAKKQESAYESLQKTIEDQQDELAKLKNEYANVVLDQGKNSASAKDLAKQIDKLSGELSDNKSKMRDADKAADQLDHSLDDLDNSAKGAGGGFTVLKGAIANLVADGIRYAISAIKDFARETIEVGKQFDTSMSQVSAVSGATGKELDMLRDKAKEMGASTKFTASEVADGFNYMAMAGWKTEDMLGGIEGVLNLAAASGSDLATTSDIVTDALTAMGYSAQDAGKLADVMAAASSNANTNVEMMGGTFKYAAPVIGALGYSMEDAAVAIGLMANAGIKGEQAGTALRSTLSRLAAPPKECATAMDALGISITEADGTMKPLNQVLEEMREAFSGLSESQQTQYAKSIAGTEAMSGLLAIVNASPADFQKLTDAVDNSNGAAERMAETMQDNLGGDLTKLGSQFEGIQIALYEKLEPALRAGTEVLSKFGDGLQWLIDHSGEVIGVLSGLAAGVAAYLAYTTAVTVMTEGWMALSVVQKAVTAAQWLMNAAMNANPIGLVVAAVAALVTAFVVLWNKSEGFRNFWIGLWEKIKEAAGAVADWFQEKWSAVVDWFSGIWDGVKAVVDKVFTWFKDNWKSLLLFLVNPVAGVFKYLYDNFEGFRNFVDKVLGAIKDFFSNAWKKITDVWGKVADWFNTNVVEPIKNFFEPLVEWFTNLFQSIWDFIASAFEIIGQLAEGCVEIIKAVWGVVSQWFDEKVVQPLTKFFTELWDGIKSAAETAWNFIKEVWEIVSGWFDANVIQPVKNFFTTLWNGISTAARNSWNAIKNVWTAVSGWFDKTVISPVKNFFKNAWDSLTRGASNAWTSIKNVFKAIPEWFRGKFSDAWQKVKNVFSTGGKIFDGIKEGITSAFKNVVNAIIRGINKVIATPFNAINKVLNKIRSVSILGISPFKGLGSISVPQIPTLARGGVLAKGQLGLLEGDGAEAVVPLDQNKKWIRAVASDLLNQIATNSGSVNTSSLSNNSEYTFTQNIYAPKQPSRIELYRQTRNLLSYAKTTGGV